MRRFVFLSLLGVAIAQSCKNYGTVNGSSCACPPGFGGDDCSLPACGGNIFQGASRRTATISGSEGHGNITSSQCSCGEGWTGTGCNVCSSASACQSGFAAVASGSSLVGTESGQNNTMTCSKGAKVWAASHMSCQVVNPTVQAAYPGRTTLNILRTLDSSRTPLPNITGFGSSGSAYAQLFYNGVEQFACFAASCTQSSSATNDAEGSSDYTCSTLQCNCISGTDFCGGTSRLNIATVINSLGGPLDITCAAPSDDGTAKCGFNQQLLKSLFGQDGLGLDGCAFGECVRQNVIDAALNNSTESDDGGGSGAELSDGVIAGLAVVGALLLLATALLLWGCVAQRRARRVREGKAPIGKEGGVAVKWNDVSYVIPGAAGARFGKKKQEYHDDKTVLDNVTGRVEPGQMMAILGPSGAGKTTLVEILAGKHKSGRVFGSVTFPLVSHSSGRTRIGFVPQQDVLPATLTVREALLFAARLRLPEGVTDSEKQARVDDVIERLGLEKVRDTRIGGVEKRGVSGGEMRRVSIGLELVASPDVLILDEPTSGLDSVSAAKVARVLHDVAHDPNHPTAILASIHQPSSSLYRTFDTVLVLAHGHALYCGPGGSAPAEYLTREANLVCPEGYNVADFLLEVASDPPVGLLQRRRMHSTPDVAGSEKPAERQEDNVHELVNLETGMKVQNSHMKHNRMLGKGSYAATFLTQLEVLAGREWRILRRDKSLFFTHVSVAAVLGVFCGGLYWNTDVTIAGFQSRVGCLFFLGALIAFSALSALYNVVESRPLFVRERSNTYYSPAAWLLARLLFDIVPLRIIPTIIVSTITYWMAGLADEASAFFKFLLILVLYTLAMTVWNYLLGCVFHNGGIAILLSALSALYQMTFAGFFVHLSDIPPVLRWLQWLCPLKYTLEALSVNEVASGLMIQDTLEGVPVNVSASLIMNLLFGFGANNYYRDVLVLVGYILGFGAMVIAVVWLRVRERR